MTNHLCYKDKDGEERIVMRVEIGNCAATQRSYMVDLQLIHRKGKYLRYGSADTLLPGCKDGDWLILRKTEYAKPIPVIYDGETYRFHAHTKLAKKGYYIR
jgi:hypothetical protein